MAHFNLASNEVTDTGCLVLADAISRGGLPNLLHMSLAGNKVGDDGLSALSTAWQAPRCRMRLEYLGLGDNVIGDRGLQRFSQALANGPGLARLSGV